MSRGLSAGARWTHPGAGNVLRKGRGRAGAGAAGRAKWYATASLPLSDAVRGLCRWQFAAVPAEQLRGGGGYGRAGAAGFSYGLSTSNFMTNASS